jgi:hypothetical protein
MQLPDECSVAKHDSKILVATFIESRKASSLGFRNLRLFDDVLVLMYAAYKHCDPLTTKLAKAKGKTSHFKAQKLSLELFSNTFRSNAPSFCDGNSR